MGFRSINMKNILLYLLLFVSIGVNGQTANDFSSVVPYIAKYSYSSNTGYYGNHLSNTQLGQMQKTAGCMSLRPFVFNYFPDNTYVTDFAGYSAAGLLNFTPCLGGVSPENRLDSNFGGGTSFVWRGLYNNIYAGDTSLHIIDTSNRFAVFVNAMDSIYGDKVLTWEIINEPDISSSSCPWDSLQACYWGDSLPQPANLENLRAPFYYYVRMLRIAWTVIKNRHPNTHITVGGIGYWTFLDQLMKNTDNPSDGSVTSAFPYKGGAYIDIISIHSYPYYLWNRWSDSCSCFVQYHYSDYAADVFTWLINRMNEIQIDNGYDNVTYPKKPIICTETGLPTNTLSGHYGSPEVARNYHMKWQIWGQYYGLADGYKFQTGSDTSTSTNEFASMGLYGDLTQPNVTPTNAPRKESFYANLTMYHLLYNKNIDYVRTAQLGINTDSTRGVAFRDNANNYVYAIWALTETNNSEVANANYSFPSNIPITGGRRYEWDYSQTGASASFTQNVALTGEVSMFLVPRSSCCNCP